MSIRRICFILCGLALLAIPVAFVLSEPDEAKPEQPVTAVATEDLSGCKHPNGTQTIPSASSPLRGELKGTAFNFETRQLALDPFTRDNKKAGTYENLIKTFREEKIGDIFFESVEGPYFVVLSGRVADLGEHYLYEFDSKEIARPDIFKGVEARGNGGEGLIPKIQLGHCYALETVSGKIVLMRLVSLRDRAAIIQWILDDTGKRILTIPKGKLIEPPPEGGGNVTVLTLKWDPQISENIKANSEYYKYVIDQLLKTARDEKASEDDRVTAIKGLGEYRPAEAVDDLFKFLDAQGKTKDEALAALIKIDKPASRRAVDLMKEAKDPGKITTYITIIRGVEGDRLAKAILENQMSKELKSAGENPEATNPNKIAADNFKTAIDLLGKSETTPTE
jgi:hypothetical protein